MNTQFYAIYIYVISTSFSLEPARDLMDLIVEGPEGDSVWVAYQDGESDSVTEDDDEMEAQLLDDDEFD